MPWVPGPSRGARQCRKAALSSTVNDRFPLLKVVYFEICLVEIGHSFDDPKFRVLLARAPKTQNSESSKVVKRKANFDQTYLKMNNF